MNSRIQIRIAALACLIALACAFNGILPKAQAQLPPPPLDGGYPGFNTAEGQKALFSLTTGVANTADGWYSLFSNTDGSYNTAVGAGTLLFNTGNQANNEGIWNTAVGTAALLFNTTGYSNTAVGMAALSSNDTGSLNTAVGTNALQNSTAGGNTAVGSEALEFNTTGSTNTAVGASALHASTIGISNTALGFGAGSQVTTANGVISIGVNAAQSVTTAGGVICIGVSGANESNRCFIGRIYSNPQPIVGTDPDSVTITSNGRLGRGNVSSRRYKHDIQPMNKASEVIYALKPVSFRYHKEYDARQTLTFGLIAEDVAEVYPDLVGRNPQGDAESVRYEQINAMLLNEFLKEHRKNEEQALTIARLDQQIQALTAGLQKVSAQLATAGPSLADSR